MVHKALNDLEGVTCNEADGALYAFPRIRLSNKAKNAAEGKGIPADEYYCLKVKSDDDHWRARAGTTRTEHTYSTRTNRM